MTWDPVDFHGYIHLVHTCTRLSTVRCGVLNMNYAFALHCNLNLHLTCLQAGEDLPLPPEWWHGEP
jgi:hypothetical protein